MKPVWNERISEEAEIEWKFKDGSCFEVLKGVSLMKR